ncbi:MAG: EAL domain-containing protein [Cohaesibacter sp.]|nr:EAL domain-containing protein [Cohaesibacter sp.]
MVGIVVRSENSRTILWSFLAATLTSVVYFAIAWTEDKAISKRENLQLLELADNFNKTYSSIRSDDMPVPATFRRMGIEHFNARTNKDANNSQTRVLWPGRPGLEINRTTDDPHLKQIIRDYVANPSAPALYEHRFEDNRLIGRTVVPSVANDKTCVSCHNKELKRAAFKLGDIMGIYVVERDMTELLLADAKYAGGLFFLAFTMTWLFATRERSRNFNIMQLKSRIEIQRMRVEVEEKEKFLLNHDPLTALPNRKLFHDYLNPAATGDNKQTLHAALIDLDDFKSVNDTMGHPAGDALLEEVARRLTLCMDNIDGLAARLGGDEFAIVWHSKELICEPDSLAQRILNEMAKPFEFENRSITPKCSIGLASWTDTQKGDPSELLKLADIALYVAKDHGKNIYQVYNQAIDATIRRQNEIAAHLTRSIREEDLRLVMQPQVSLHDGRFIGFEALSRWTINGYEIRPAEFIAIAESTGTIRELDLQVLRKAVNFSADLEKQTGLAVPISVNLSANSFRSGSLLEDIQTILWAGKLPADRLTLEITETAAIENWQHVQDILGKLRAAGVRASLDDFGTGYSSLAYLLRMKFDQIKIDREFIQDIKDGNENHILLQHISDMVAGLGMELVIEGVETQKQFELIKNSVKGGGQGYYFARPMELDAARTYLQETVRLKAV